MAITRTPIIDDDGSRTTGTIWNNAWKVELYDQIDAANVASAALAPTLPGTTAPTTTGTVTAEPIPTGTGILYTYHNNATLKTIQGMVAGAAGQLWVHYSKGAGQVDFAHLHASGTALGKCKLFATTGLTSMAAGAGVMVFQYDATVTQWRLVHHEQGAWIAVPYVAGNFTASGTMAWTVDSGDILINRYWLKGRTLFWTLSVGTTTVAAPLSTALKILVPSAFSTVNSVLAYTALALLFDNGAATVGRAYLAADNTHFEVYRLDGANYTAATNNTALVFNAICEVQ